MQLQLKLTMAAALMAAFGMASAQEQGVKIGKFLGAHAYIFGQYMVLSKDKVRIDARVVQTAFSQRRKTLRNTLGGLLKPEDFVALGIDAGLRAEALPLADYERITTYLMRRR